MRIIIGLRIFHLDPVNVSLSTHFHSTYSNLIDFVFVNNVTRVLLYDQISVYCFFNHDLLFFTYNPSVNPDDNPITFRDFKNIDFTVLNGNIDNICWVHVYLLDNINDQLALIHENVRLIYDRCVPVRSKFVSA